MRSSLLFLVLACLLSALAGCGTKGPLYLPKQPQTGTAAKASVHNDTNP